MSTVKLQDKLRKAIQSADEPLLNALSDMVDMYKANKASSYNLTASQKSDLDSRAQENQERYSWEEAKAIL